MGWKPEKFKFTYFDQVKAWTDTKTFK